MEQFVCGLLFGFIIAMILQRWVIKDLVNHLKDKKKDDDDPANWWKRGRDEDDD